MNNNQNTENNSEVVAPALSSEEKLIIWWNDQKPKILGVLGLIILAIIAYQVLGIIQKQKITSLQSAYQSAVNDPVALKTFASENDGTNLAGLAWLELADRAYQKEEYSTAATLYHNAAKSLQEANILSRAKLGHAVSLSQDNNKSESISVFQSIIDNESYTANARGQAAYKLILIAVEAKDKSLADQSFEKLKNLPNNTIWMSQAERLLNRLS